MRAIPPKQRKEINDNDWYRECKYPGCASKQVEIHHCCQYSGRQIAELWNYVPLCHEHHSSKEGRDWAELLAITRMTEEDRMKYNKRDWLQRAKYLYDIRI